MRIYLFYVHSQNLLVWAGIRIGYGVSNSQIIDPLQKIKIPWNCQLYGATCCKRSNMLSSFSRKNM